MGLSLQQRCAATVLGSKAIDKDPEEVADVLDQLDGFVTKGKHEYAAFLLDRMGKGDPSEFQESFVTFLRMANMWDEDGRKES